MSRFLAGSFHLQRPKNRHSLRLDVAGLSAHDLGATPVEEVTVVRGLLTCSAFAVVHVSGLGTLCMCELFF